MIVMDSFRDSRIQGLDDVIETLSPPAPSLGTVYMLSEDRGRDANFHTL